MGTIVTQWIAILGVQGWNPGRTFEFFMDVLVHLVSVKGLGIYPDHMGTSKNQGVYSGLAMVVPPDPFFMHRHTCLEVLRVGKLERTIKERYLHSPYLLL